MRGVLQQRRPDAGRQLLQEERSQLGSDGGEGLLGRGVVAGVNNPGVLVVIAQYCDCNLISALRLCDYSLRVLFFALTCVIALLYLKLKLYSLSLNLSVVVQFGQHNNYSIAVKGPNTSLIYI